MRMKSQMVLAAENGLCAKVAKVEEEKTEQRWISEEYQIVSSLKISNIRKIQHARNQWQQTNLGNNQIQGQGVQEQVFIFGICTINLKKVRNPYR